LDTLRIGVLMKLGTLERNHLETLFQHHIDTGYLYFVDGEPVTNPRDLVDAIEQNRKIISVSPTQGKNKI